MLRIITSQLVVYPFISDVRVCIYITVLSAVVDCYLVLRTCLIARYSKMETRIYRQNSERTLLLHRVLVQHALSNYKYYYYSEEIVAKYRFCLREICLLYLRVLHCPHVCDRWLRDGILYIKCWYVYCLFPWHIALTWFYSWSFASSSRRLNVFFFFPRPRLLLYVLQMP